MSRSAESELPGCARTVRSGWRRVAHSLLAAFVGLAAMGLFGDGPWAWTALEQSGVRIEYDRVLHVSQAGRLRIRVPEADGDAVVVELPSETIRNLDLERVSPDPLRRRATADGMRLEIASQPGQDVEIDVHFSARSPGWHRMAVRVLPHRLTVGQLVLP